jgi:hypothetical protein
MLREIDRFLGRIELSHLLYIQFDCVSVKASAGYRARRTSPAVRILHQGRAGCCRMAAAFLRRPYSCDVALTASQIVATTPELQEQ